MRSLEAKGTIRYDFPQALFQLFRLLYYGFLVRGDFYVSLKGLTVKSLGTSGVEFAVSRVCWGSGFEFLAAEAI